MEYKVTLSTEEIVRGLKHYRRIAKQDVLRAPETPSPEYLGCMPKHGVKCMRNWPRSPRPKGPSR
jgi:hypothetical protein